MAIQRGEIILQDTNFANILFMSDTDARNQLI